MDIEKEIFFNVTGNRIQNFGKIAKLKSYLTETVFMLGQRLTTSDQEFGEDTFFVGTKTKRCILYSVHGLNKYQKDGQKKRSKAFSALFMA